MVANRWTLLALVASVLSTASMGCLETEDRITIDANQEPYAVGVESEVIAHPEECWDGYGGTKCNSRAVTAFNDATLENEDVVDIVDAGLGQHDYALRPVGVVRFETLEAGRTKLGVEVETASGTETALGTIEVRRPNRIEVGIETCNPDSPENRVPVDETAPLFLEVYHGDELLHFDEDWVSDHADRLLSAGADPAVQVEKREPDQVKTHFTETYQGVKYVLRPKDLPQTVMLQSAVDPDYEETFQFVASCLGPNAPDAGDRPDAASTGDSDADAGLQEDARSDATSSGHSNADAGFHEDAQSDTTSAADSNADAGLQPDARPGDDAGY